MPAILNRAQAIFCLLILSLFAASIPGKFESSNLHAQSTPFRVAINVIKPSLPVTIGIPISESAKILDASTLGVTDSQGSPRPSQMRVLSRWRGLPNDTTKPVKWVLADFKPASAGIHYLTRTSSANFNPVTVNDAADGLRISNSQIEIVFSKQDQGLIRSFKLGGNETLSAPATAQIKLPRRAFIAHLSPSAGLATDSMIATDTSLLKSGDQIKFEHTEILKWNATAGGSQLVTADQSFAGNRRYRVDEGTPKEEDVDVTTAQAGDLRTAAPLRFDHTVGAPLRDLSIEQEVATIKSINGQTVVFTAPLKPGHVAGEKVFVPGTSPVTATAQIERASVEESNGLRVVVRQDGIFKSSAGKTPALAFTLRYYIYSDQPFVRARLRMTNNGAYGYGAYRTGQAPFSQPMILRSISINLPTVIAGSRKAQVLSSGEAHALVAQDQNTAQLAVGSFEIGVAEFAENYPDMLQSSTTGMRFDLLPDLGKDEVFDGARAKTTDFYLGRNTSAACAMTNSLGAIIDPAYIATTGAVRPVFVERRNWTAEINKDSELSEATARFEKMLASGYAVEATEAAGAVPQISIFEYRERSENGEQFGWRNFGDLAWGDGYANVHYDLPYILLREYLRSGDPRAFQLGSEMARYRADWGHYRSNDFLDRERTWNLKGMAFYEKGDHGSFKEPVPSHTWIEGMWLYWALTGDEAARESAVDGSEAFYRMNLTYDNALGWNEPRWLGWPTLGLMVAYRYTGETKYLTKARSNVLVFVQTEESFGRKGYYLSSNPGTIQGVQPWAWSYSLLGVIEYWRDTGDKRVADFIVRVADWLISKNSNNPPLKPGVMMPDGTYLPTGVPYFWYPNEVSGDRSVHSAGMCLPILTTAARITGRQDIWARAREVFRDYAFYRDFAEGKSVTLPTRAVINFRSLLFGTSATKVYGQMGLMPSDYLPELISSGLVRPSNQWAGGPFTQPLPVPPTAPTATPTPVSAPIDTSKLTNAALNRPAMASSVKTWPDVLGLASAANDGKMVSSGLASSWHSASNSGQMEWWQVDLGRSYRIAAIEINFRDDQNQPWVRRNFEIRGSNDLNFKTSTVLASQGDQSAPYKQAWMAQVSETGGFRYVRVQKTRIDADALGQSFFNLAEVRVMVPSAGENAKNTK